MEVMAAGAGWDPDNWVANTRRILRMGVHNKHGLEGILYACQSNTVQGGNHTGDF